MTLAVTDKVIVVKDLYARPPPRCDRPDGPRQLDARGGRVVSAGPARGPAGESMVHPRACRPAVLPRPQPLGHDLPLPEEVTSVRMSAAVESVRGGIARLTFEGRIAGVHRGTENEARKGQECSGEAKLVAGVGSYDIRAGKMISLNLVWDGWFRNYPPYDDPPSRFGAVVEWRASP